MYNNQPSLLDNLRKIAKENIYSEEPTKKSHENPLYDLMVNIPEEASKTDPIGKVKYKAGGSRYNTMIWQISSWLFAKLDDFLPFVSYMVYSGKSNRLDFPGFLLIFR